MEVEILKKSSTSFAPTAKTSSGMHKNSQIIAKVKPKIRIIHIFAPEIIKTDVANFRELVQRLTGKPTAEMAGKNGSMLPKKRPRNRHNLPTKPSVMDHSSSRSCFSHQYPMIHKPFGTKLELRSGFLKGEEEIWRNANSGGGFLGGFAELEGFMEQLNQEFPLLPATLPLEAAYLHHHVDA